MRKGRRVNSFDAAEQRMDNTLSLDNSFTVALDMKPLTVNQAWQGRRFSTKAKKAYEAALSFALPKHPVYATPYYRVYYEFHLVRFASIDWDNCVKVLQDCLVKQSIISDDRLIVDARVRKLPAKKDRIVVRVGGCGLDTT